LASVFLAVLVASGAALAVTPVDGVAENTEAEAAVAPEDPDASLDRALERLVAIEGGSPGVIAVVQRGQHREVHAFGVADLEDPTRPHERRRPHAHSEHRQGLQWGSGALLGKQGQALLG